MKFLPMTVETVHEAILECLIVEGTMTRDFGPWKKGLYLTLTFNFEDGVVQEHDQEGNVVMSVKVALEVVP